MRAEIAGSPLNGEKAIDFSMLKNNREFRCGAAVCHSHASRNPGMWIPDQVGDDTDTAPDQVGGDTEIDPGASPA